MGTDTENENPLLKDALKYAHQGWSVIPVSYGDKRPAIKRWLPYQSKSPDEKQILEWFSGGKKNIAVILGPVSGGLCCRDFDKIESYQQWAAQHPQLAKTLPIVRTSRGMHVYFQNNDVKTQHYSDGELRGQGGYCLLPPSVHPDGPEYEWQNYPIDGVMAIDPQIAGFIGNLTEQTEQAENTEAYRANVSNSKVSGQIEKIIQKTLPVEFGTRNQRIFTFARELKSLPEFSNSDPRTLSRIVKEWHKRALPKIRTKEFEETKIDFLKAWPRITTKIGDEPMAELTKKAFSAKPPKIALQHYPDNPQLQIFVSLCRQLQKADEQNTFYISCRKAAEILHTSPDTISRWFYLLESDGIVKVVERGGTAERPRKASRYKYLAK